MSEADDALTRALHGLNPHVRGVLRELATSSGLAPDCRPYLAQRMRYLIGAGSSPTPPPRLRGSLTEWANQRAQDLLEANHRRLPSLPDGRRP